MPGSSRRTIRSIRSSNACLPRCKSPPPCSRRTGSTMPNERPTPAQGTAAAWRMVYRFALYLLLPLALARLWWRGRRVPAYRRRWAERLGCIAPLPSAGAVWVGETVAAAPLIKWLLARGETVLVTTTTPSGSDRVRALFGQDVHHCYCPFDLLKIFPRGCARPPSPRPPPSLRCPFLPFCPPPFPPPARPCFLNCFRHS